MKNFVIPLFFIGAFFITVNCNCNRDEDCIKNYNFETHYNLTPTQDSFSIGDTIWISCDFSNQLYDRGGDSINFTGQSLLAEFFLGRIDTSPYIQNYQDFEFIENIGQF